MTLQLISVSRAHPANGASPSGPAGHLLEIGVGREDLQPRVGRSTRGTICIAPFERLPYWDGLALTEVYRRLVLAALPCENLIHRLCEQIPAPRQHLVRYYGHYSNRSRGARRESGASFIPTPLNEDVTPEQRARRRSWARLLR